MFMKLFKVLKDDAVKSWTHYASKFGKFNTEHRTGKDQFSFQPQGKEMPVSSVQFSRSVVSDSL